MATIKDVNYSFNGEPKSKHEHTIEHDIVQDIIVKTDPTVSRKTHIFKLKATNKKGGTYIHGIEDAYNPETKTVERMRLISGVTEIWMSKQKDIPVEYVKQNIRSIYFQRNSGRVFINDIDKSALEFLRNSNHNIGNPNRTNTGGKFDFYEYDPAREAKLALEREEFELEMAIKAKQEPADKMKKHAAFLGISLIDNITHAEKEEALLRKEYVIYAKRNPAYFKQTLGDKQIEVFDMVSKAIRSGKIELNRESNKAHWGNGGGLICMYPVSENPDRYITNLALTPNEDGMRIKQMLEQITLT